MQTNYILQYLLGRAQDKLGRRFGIWFWRLRMAIEKASVLVPAQKTLSGRHYKLLEELADFVVLKLRGTEYAHNGLIDGWKGFSEAQLQWRLSNFLRGGWDVLDGVARVVNCILYVDFPDSGLQDPEVMTRQCGLYTVREALHRHPETAGGRLDYFIWSATRAAPAMGYRRLSFLYNLSIFVNIPLVCDGKALPGFHDVPECLQGLVKQQDVSSVPVADGLDEMWEWLIDFAGECWALIADR
jgi:hypothetical protein